MQQQGNPSYASVERCITLPERHRLSEKTKLFKNIVNDGMGTQLSQPLVNKTNDLLQELNETFYVYEKPKEFEFTFPDSMFPAIPEGETNDIKYEQKMIREDENTFKNRLSEEQLQQIKATGEFKVKSNIEYITLPYVWRINPVIFWGSDKIHKAWVKELSVIYGLFWSAKKFIEHQIPLQLARMKKLPKALFSIFFGSKSIKTVISVDYQQQIYKDFWNKLLGEYYKDSQEWFSAIWNYLYVYYDPEMERPYEYTGNIEFDKKKQAEKEKLRQKYSDEQSLSSEKQRVILEQESKFMQEWSKLRKRLIIEITDEVSGVNNSVDNKADSEEEMFIKESEDNSDERILEKLAERKLTLYIKHLERQLPQVNVPLQVVNAIVMMLRLFTVISRINAKFNKEGEKQKKAVEEKIRREHTIKSLYHPYFSERVTDEMKPINSSLEVQYCQTLQKDPDFTTFLSKDQLEAYKQLLKVRFNSQMLQSAKKLQRPEYHGPTRTFYSTYPLLPPYKVNYECNYYTLKKESEVLTIDTSTAFWKLRLYWMRVKSWTITCLVFLVFSALKGPVGLRCLWGIEDFDYNMDINGTTGEIYYHKRSTVIGTFLTVLKGIKKSRAHFEQAPDLGLLGKNVSRIFNYIECYAFRLLFVGIILTILGYPLLILAASAVTIALVVTFWAWMPVMLFITYLFNILILQFETSIQRYDVYSRVFPLLTLVARFLGSILMIILSGLNLVVLAPICTICIFGLLLVQQFFRRSLDKLMMTIFSKLGRTPSRDSAIAKKISGPGMTKEFYMSINEQDVYILIRSSLQKTFMQKLNTLLTSKMHHHGTLVTKIINRILSPFNANYSTQNEVVTNKNLLANNYNKQYSHYMKRYPHNPKKVRFTQEEIDGYFPNTVTIVQNYVEKNCIQGWIFDQHELYEGMFQELTRYVWMEIFGCGEEIFQPLEKMDSRFKLEDQYKADVSFNRKMKKNVGSVMKALEGEMELSHNAHKKHTPFKHNLLSRERSIEQVSGIFGMYANNSQTSVSLNPQNVKCLFVPNLNIKEIIIVQDESRLRQIKARNDIIDI